MLKTIWRQIADTLDNEADRPAEDRGQAIRLATAALLIEVARADHDYDPDEFERLLDLVQRRFSLAPDAAVELANNADRRVDDAVSLHEFTKVLHEHLSVDEKAEVVAIAWEVAYVDGRLDMYEDSMILKISDLLYVPRGEVMRSKHAAKNRRTT